MRFFNGIIFVLLFCFYFTLESSEIVSNTIETAMVSDGALQKLKNHIQYNPKGPNQIGHLIVEDHSNSINQGTWLYIKDGLDYYKKTKPLFIILELNTPGGEVFAAQKISDALKNFDTQYDIPIVCFINNWAISAGAMLAYSCRFITTTKDGSMGAAEPVILGEKNEMVPASEKINSALRADFGNRAYFFDRSPVLAEAMVDKDMIVVYRDGKVIKLDSESQIRTGDVDQDIIISPKGKLLTLNAEQMVKYGVADLLVFPHKTEAITESEKESGKWPASKMLLFHAPFFDQIPGAMIDNFQMSWKARFFALLASPLVSSLLLLGLFLGFYIELSSPGFGVPGTIGLTCLILIILSSLALEIANWLEVILLLVGLVMIGVDLFIFPTFGLLGGIGLLFFIGGLFGLLLPGLESVEYEVDTKTFNAAGQYVLERMIWFGMTLLVGTGFLLLLARYVTPSLAVYSSLILKGNEQDASKGYIAGDDPRNLPPKGSIGEVVASLRPAGKVMIDSTFYEALSAGNYIEKGEKIKVIRHEGSVIVVDIVHKILPGSLF
ncbi:MAG: NfeD family protein [Parachlamydiaceae bacterium]